MVSIYVFFFQKTISTDTKAKFWICGILPMMISHISTTKHTICESLMNGENGNSLNWQNDRAMLCKQAGIKKSNITHPCGSAMVLAVRAGQWLYYFAALVLYRSHWNIFQTVLQQSPHVNILITYYLLILDISVLCQTLHSSHNFMKKIMAK